MLWIHDQCLLTRIDYQIHGLQRKNSKQGLISQHHGLGHIVAVRKSDLDWRNLWHFTLMPICQSNRLLSYLCDIKSQLQGNLLGHTHEGRARIDQRINLHSLIRK